jgi:hypothetical protein
MWNSLAGVALFGGVFTFLAVAVWSGNRTRERELYYRNELLKKAIETPGPEAAAVLAHIKDEEAAQARARAQEKRMGLVIGGLSAVGAGIGLMFFLHNLDGPARATYMVGLVPVLVGMALLVGSRLANEK